MEFLSIDGNQINKLPSEIGSMVGLTDLWVGNNKITSLTSEIGNLKILETLLLNDNKLESLPAEITNLLNLKDFWLHDNKLKSFPEELTSLIKLENLVLDYSSDYNIPPNIKIKQRGHFSGDDILSLYHFEVEIVNSLNALKTSITTSEDMGCDVKSLDGIKENCDKYLEKKEYSRALDEIQKGVKKVDSLQYEAAERMFSESKLMVIEAKKVEIDTSYEKDWLKKAKEYFADKDYVSTYKYSKWAFDDADKKIKIRQNAYDAISKSAGIVAEDKKIKLDVKDEMNTLLVAKELFENNEYEKAFNEANKILSVRESKLKYDDSTADLPIGKILDIWNGEVEKLFNDTITHLGKAEENEQNENWEQASLQ